MKKQSVFFYDFKSILFTSIILILVLTQKSYSFQNSNVFNQLNKSNGVNVNNNNNNNDEEKCFCKVKKNWRKLLKKNIQILKTIFK